MDGNSRIHLVEHLIVATPFVCCRIQNFGTSLCGSCTQKFTDQVLINSVNFQQVKPGWIVSNGVVRRNEYCRGFLFYYGRYPRRKGSARDRFRYLCVSYPMFRKTGVDLGSRVSGMINSRVPCSSMISRIRERHFYRSLIRLILLQNG